MYLNQARDDDSIIAQFDPIDAFPGQRKHWTWSGWWWQEILSNIAGLSCIIAVIRILKTMENQNIDRWTFYVSKIRKCL